MRCNTNEPINILTSLKRCIQIKLRQLNREVHKLNAERNSSRNVAFIIMKLLSVAGDELKVYGEDCTLLQGVLQPPRDNVGRGV